MIYSIHVSAESCSLWQVFDSRLVRFEHIYKYTTATTKNNNLYIQLFSPGTSHLAPFFVTHTALLVPDVLRQRNVLLEQFNYDILVPFFFRSLLSKLYLIN